VIEGPMAWRASERAGTETIVEAVHILEVEPG
jgi:hypothetical protein